MAVSIAFGNASFLGSELQSIFPVEFSLVHELVDASGERLRGFCLSTSRTFFSGTNHQSDFPLRRMSFERLEKFGESAAAEFLMDLGDFARQAGGPVAENGGGIGDRFRDAMGRLVEDEGAILDAKSFQCTLAFAGAGREETEEKEFVVGKAGSGKRGEKCDGAGNGDHRDVVADRECDEAVAGVGNQRHTCIADERDVGTLFHGENKFGSASEFVVLVIAHEWLVNIEVIQEFERVAGVFAGNLIDFFEDAKCTQGDIFQVADGSGNEE